MQALEAALVRVKAAMPDGTVHESDSDAVTEIKDLTLEVITEKTTLGLQVKISNLIALRTQASIITRLSIPGKEADLRAFRSCCGPKAGSWLNSSDSRFDTQMADADFTVAFAMRNCLEPFADVDADYMCKLCGNRMGNSCTHATLCKKGGSSGRTERHDGLKYAFARSVREYHVEARVRVEPNVVRHCKLRAVNHAKSSRCRADLLVTDSEGLYIYDFVVSNAAAASAPVAANSKSGIVADKSVKAKDAKYTKKFKGVKPGINFFACGAESHGCLHPLFVSVLRELVDRKEDSGSDWDTPKSVHASRLFERIGVALQQGNAQGILDFRYKEIDAPENAEYDAVMGALNTKLLSLADCDADLIDEADEDREMLLMEDGVANDVDLSLQLELPVGNDQAGPVMQNADGVQVVAQGHGYVLGLQHDEDGGGDVLGPQALAGFGLAAQLAAVGLAMSVSDLEFSSGGSFGSASATGSASGGSVGSGSVV